MHGRTNAGGGVSAKAFIQTTYPEGSICTCSNGTRTLKARDTSGYMMFILPAIGKWTVTATDPADPTNTDSETVEITTEGQSVNVELSYELWLIKDGVMLTDFVVTNRKASAGIDAVASLTNNEYEASSGTHVLYILNAGGNTWSSNSIETKEAFNVSGFSALNIQGWYIHGDSGVTADSYAYCYEGAAPTYNNDCPGKVNLSKDTETTVSIPLLGFDSVKAGISIAEYNGGIASRIRNMWFS